MRRAHGRAVATRRAKCSHLHASDKVKLPKKEKNPAPELRILPQPDQEKWLDSLESVLEFALKNQGPQQTSRFLDSLTDRLREQGVEAPRVVSTPYCNTITT